MANNCKYYKEKEQVSHDGGITWDDTGDVRKGELYEQNSPDCGTYRWQQADDEFICEGAIKYYKQYKQFSDDGGQTWNTVYPAETRKGDIMHYGSAECLGISATTSDYLTFYAVDNCTFHCNWAWAYSIDGGEWINYTVPSVIPAPVSVPSGHTISMRIPPDSQYGLELSSNTNGRYIAYGNAFSACMEIDGVNWDTVTPTSSPRWIFRSDSSRNGLTDASMLLLPAKNISDNMYENMFRGCSNMVLPPKVLPATVLKGCCYEEMFYDCRSMIESPILPAATLVRRCYYGMFVSCSSLKKVTCLATDRTQTSDGSAGWLSGVGNSGVFYKNSLMNQWTIAGNAIPQYWTVRDYSD